MDCKVNQSWAAVYQSVARRMLSFSDNSEALKVDTKELEDHVLAPSEPRVDIDQREVNNVKYFSRSSADKEQKRS